MNSALLEGFHYRRGDPSSKGYGVKGLFAAEVASDERKFAPGIVSFAAASFKVAAIQAHRSAQNSV